MRFIVDECTGPTVARWLREHEHDVYSIFEESRGLGDLLILEKAVTDNRILITNDKDFGEMIFRDGRTHGGVVLLRLEDERSANKVAVVEQLLAEYANQLVDHFIVASEKTVRISGGNTK